MKILLCGVFLLVLVSVPARAQLVLYDDFNARFIAPQKWVVNQSGNDSSREYVREIQSNSLRMAIRNYGNTNSDSGGRFDGTFLEFPNPDPVTAIQATILVSDFEVTACVNSSTAGGARAELFGDFFNTSTPVPGSHLNDVRANINVVRFTNSLDPENILRAQAFMVECTSADCSAGTLLGFQDLGPVVRGEPATVAMTWNQIDHSFVFKLGDNPEVVLPYSVSDTAPPGARRKGLLLAGSPPNCTASPRPTAFMEAFFDDVFVNASEGKLVRGGNQIKP